ncbi:MAG: hypothetical protein BMS9Abin32_321 [Gammaproteobacteria bacterium]|nr:MAG: hypothetical protein BMS9Abin32_321 [Gammaproteobacteria bacterium]
MLLLRSIVAICLPAVAATVLAEPRNTNDGVYTKAQAKAGEQIYRTQCLTCHDKKYFRPVFKAWNEQSLQVFYQVMSASMPESNPGSLSSADYVDILAYILSLNRYQAGDTELSNEGDALAGITIVPRQRKPAREQSPAGE